MKTNENQLLSLEAYQERLLELETISHTVSNLLKHPDTMYAQKEKELFPLSAGGKSVDSFFCII